MGSCHGSNNISSENLIHHKNLEFFSLVYLDNTLKNFTFRQRFRSIINYFKIFKNEDDCEEYFKQMSKGEYVIFIVNDQIGQKFLPRIHHLQQIFSIYIYSPNKTTDQQWINQFNKIKSFCHNYDELMNQIQTDQIRCKHIKDEILFDIFHSDHVSESNNQFLCSQILIDILLQMNSISDDMSDLLSLCREQYKGNKSQLNILREFQQTYTSDQALSWLTRDSIISQILNKAIRTQNIDLIFLYRFFLHDIEQQLIQNQCLSSIKTYRYQLISERKLQLLKDSIGQFISINNFLLTNLNRNSAFPTTKVPLIDNAYQPILFEITAYPSLEKIKPFARITSRNHDQTEVLFMLGSIFQLNNIRQNENNIWIIEMTLTNQMNKQLKSILDHYKNDDNEEINLLSLGYILQKMNKLDESEKYYRRLFNELPEEDERIGYCCLNLGNLAFAKNDYDASLEWLLKSLDISIRTLPSNDPSLALIYKSLGHIYNAKHDTKLALESYQNAICMWKQSFETNHLNIAECMNNIGIIHKQERNYSLALEYFKKTLIILEKYPSNNQFDLSRSHCNIASIYKQLGEYDLALDHYNISFDILENNYPVNHPNIAKALGNIGIIYALKGERQKALIYYEKTAGIYRQTLPPTHINNIKIEQLIRNVSSPPRGISFGSTDS